MRTRPALLLTLLAFAIALSALPAGAAAHSAAVRMIERVNEVRQAHGLSALKRAPALQRGSKAHSRTLLAAGSLWHASLSSEVARYGQAGEVLAMHSGARAAIGWTIRAWLNSAPHRSVLLSSSFRRAGAGRSSGSFGGGLGTVWVLRTG
jgi:uncharacterized protein YkwD